MTYQDRSVAILSAGIRGPSWKKCACLTEGKKKSNKNLQAKTPDIITITSQHNEQ